MPNKKALLAGLLAFLLPFYLIRFDIGIPTTLLEVVTILIFLYLFLSDPNNLWQKLKQSNRFILLGILLMITGGVLGVLVSLNKTVALGELKGYLIVPILASLCLVQIGKGSEKYAKYGLYLSASLVAIEAIVERLIGVMTPDGRVLGVYRLDAHASPNYLALFLTPIAILLLHDLFHEQLTNKKIVAGLSFVAMGVAVILSESRAGVGILALAIFYEAYIYCIRKYRKLLVNLFFGIVLIGMLFFIIKISLPHLSAQANSGRVTTSNNIRLEIWQTTVQKIIPQHWLLGVGLGNYQTVFKKTTLHWVNFDEYISPLAVTPHDVFLSTWMNLGLVGLIGFLLVLYGAFQELPLSSGWSISLISILGLGLVDTPIYKNDLSTYFWIVVIAGSYFYHRTRGKNELR